MFFLSLFFFYNDPPLLFNMKSAFTNWELFIIYPSNERPLSKFSASQRKRKSVCPCVIVYTSLYLLLLIHVKNQQYTIIFMLRCGSNLIDLIRRRTILSIYQLIQTEKWLKAGLILKSSLYQPVVYVFWIAKLIK